MFWIVYSESRWPNGERLAGYETAEEAELQASYDLAMGMEVLRIDQGDVNPVWDHDAENNPELAPELEPYSDTEALEAQAQSPEVARLIAKSGSQAETP